ncbi:MAG: thioredoxin domain-containing protein [Phycisphaerales bacterium]|nr:thioredoxin domain-containing protein [Phycisphaerales bacterium]
MSKDSPPRPNRLIQSTSPYLLQHAHNPVDWRPWDAEALEKARREDKPIFLSIGYSACHWCHVMERESFENERLAAVLNEHFVPVKVDREERPDLDELYMKATMLANRGQGGWPMSVFLTPEGKPFFAGTYFPPERRWGHPGFGEILLAVAQAWRERREEVIASADRLAEGVAVIGQLNASQESVSRQDVDQAARTLAETFDPVDGGLLSGQSNKFPPALAMSLMLRVYHRLQREGKNAHLLLDRVETTLHKMADGGIYDHLAGGIARYSTDPKWLVPHLEKMLYDQALVSAVYIEAFRVSGNTRYADVARHILDYVLADLLAPEGGFYSARDADSEGVEGKYYVWSRVEIMSLLGDERGAVFCDYYDVTEDGNWEGRNILNVQRDVETVAKLRHMAQYRVSELLAEGRAILLDARSKRVPPALDDKILTAWNGLMISALARAGHSLNDTKYIDAASRAADFLLSKLSLDGRLLRSYRAGKAHIGGYLDDYAFFIESLLTLHETTFDLRWLGEAERLHEDMLKLFWDVQAGGFFFTADDAEGLFLRAKETHDGPVPAGQSVALMNLLRLGYILERPDWLEKAETLARLLAEQIKRTPFGSERLLAAVDFALGPPRQVVILGSLANPDTRALIETVHRVYDPGRVVLVLDPASPTADTWRRETPLLSGKTMIKGKPTAFVCCNMTCSPPVNDPELLLKELKTQLVQTPSGGR